MDLREIRWKRLYCIDLVQDREKWRAIVKTAGETSGSKKHGEILD